MESSNNIRVLLFGVLAVIVNGDAPYAAAIPKVEIPLAPYPPAIQKIDVPLAPYPPAIPATTYGVPELKVVQIPKIVTNYDYKLITPPKIVQVEPYPAKIDLPLAPYPPAEPIPVYGVPRIAAPLPIKTEYEYKLITPPKVEIPLGPYPPARIENPAPIYGLPREEVLVPAPKPVTTTYEYRLITPPKVNVPLGPYPPARIENPAPIYGLPREEILVPAPKPVTTTYEYRLITPPKINVPLGPYPPAIVEKKLSPYPPAIPVAEYGVPRIEVLPPPKPILTNYEYKLITPAKVELPLAPYPSAVEKIAPYPPAAPIPVYGPPLIQRTKPITTTYEYKVLTPPKPIEIPTPVYGLPRVEPIYGVPKIDLPILPEPVYGVPRIEVAPQKPILTSYNYQLPLEQVKRVELVKTIVPVIPPTPHLRYGL